MKYAFVSFSNTSYDDIRSSALGAALVEMHELDQTDPVEFAIQIGLAPHATTHIVAYPVDPEMMVNVPPNTFLSRERIEKQFTDSIDFGRTRMPHLCDDCIEDGVIMIGRHKHD